MCHCFWLLLVKSSGKAALIENADFLAGVTQSPPHPSILKRCTISITHLSLGLVPSFSPRPALVSPPGNSSHGSWWVGNMTHGIIRNGKTWDPNTHLCACATSGGFLSHCTVIFKESVRKLSPAELSFTISWDSILHVAYLYIYLIYYGNYLSTYLDMTPLSAQDDTNEATSWLLISHTHIQRSSMVRSAASGTNRKLK